MRWRRGSPTSSRWPTRVRAAGLGRGGEERLKEWQRLRRRALPSGRLQNSGRGVEPIRHEENIGSDKSDDPQRTTRGMVPRKSSPRSVGAAPRSFAPTLSRQVYATFEAVPLNRASEPQLAEEHIATGAAADLANPSAALCCLMRSRLEGIPMTPPHFNQDHRDQATGARFSRQYPHRS